ncbi:MAG TPA: type II toxin-antitoxin system RelE/ParE family toxin [Salinimicrobium sp.]|nr:type II toxin-antitoxin system RelE/ParE family toxin [Salinimicrobium sp.]
MEIIWSDFAIQNLKEIFDYYKSKASNRVANKIRKQILQSSKQLINNPELGPIEFNLENLKLDHRFLLSGNYKIIYRIEKDRIFINDIFDVRQNPDKMIHEKKDRG